MTKDNGWQPIATAPRDGTPVDLLHKCGERFTDEWWVEDDGDAFWCGSLLPDSEFTHWMPIPPPPGMEQVK
jgi:hypothetical protein